MAYYKGPQEVWDLKRCGKAAKYAPKDHWGNRPPKGIIVADSASMPLYGKRRYNGGIVIDGEWYEGTDNPYPLVPPPYGLFWLSAWGVIITASEDGKKRGLPPLRVVNVATTVLS